MKIACYSLVTSALLVVGLSIFLGQDPILIQSWESKTTSQGAVFNQIQFFPGLQRDVWMMNQSHAGVSAHGDKWDRLAIVVDVGKKARFLQLPPGKLEWDDRLLEQAGPNRVSCFLCHSNGPRAIRPDPDFKFGIKEKLKIAIWNLRIKTYRRIQESELHLVEDATRNPPFRHRGSFDNEELNVSACVKCHSETGIFQRGKLTRQNFLAIRFMLKNKLMPPPGFSLTDEDRVKIEDFLVGI